MPIEIMGLKKPLVNDCDLIRIQIPGVNAVETEMSAALLKMLKDLIGKDLSKAGLPVFLNEPTSILMKTAE